MSNEKADDFSSFSCLRKLILTKNGYNRLPNLPESLESLVIDQNQLEEISDRITRCQKLKKLDFSSNSLDSFGELKDNTSIEMVLIGQNQIESIACLEFLPNLRVVDFQDNRVNDSPKKIKAWITSHVSLLAVNLIGNPISQSTYPFLLLASKKDSFKGDQTIQEHF